MSAKQKAVQKRSKRPPTTLGAGDATVLREEIQLLAYYRYCARARAPGAELDDWLSAEREVLAASKARSSAPAPASGKTRNRPR